MKQEDKVYPVTSVVRGLESKRPAKTGLSR
jgi:hypothetical protein